MKECRACPMTASCAKLHLPVNLERSKIVAPKKKKQNSLSFIVMIMVTPWMRADWFIFVATMTLLSWLFKRRSARWTGGRWGWVASCSCGNLRSNTMERGGFSRSPAPHFQTENGRKRTITITVDWKVLRWMLNKSLKDPTTLDFHLSCVHTTILLLVLWLLLDCCEKNIFK